MPYPLPLTRTEAYLAYKAGVIQQSDLKPSLAVPRNGIDAWLAYWTGLAADYPKREDGTPHILQEEEAYIAYLCGVINEYPEKCLRRVGAYLRYLISARWGRPDHPLNREELYLSLIKTQFIPSGDPSSDIVIDGTAKAAFVDVKMYGDTTQQTYTGQNLYNVATLQTGANVTKDDDGWITVTRDNSSGSSTSYTNIWTDNLDLETSTQYAIVVEIKAASGTGELDITSTNATQGQFSSWQGRQVASLAAGQVFKVTPTTKSSFSGIYGGLRTILTLKAGQSASVTFRLSVLADASVGPSGFVYEPFVGGQPSPSPDYPQPIQTVAGEQTVEIQGKNLFNKDKALDKYFYTSTGSKSTYSKAQFYNNNFVPTSDKITMSYSAVHDRQSGSIIEANVRIVQYDASGNFISRLMSRTNGYTFTLDANTKSFILCIDNGPDAWFDDLQVEYGPTATAYTPYSKQTLPLDLGSIELCKLGDYQDYIYKDGDDWKVHKAVAKHALKPNEGWLIPNPASYPNLFQTNAISDLGNLSDAYTTASTSPQAYCEALVYLPGSGDVRTTQGFSLYHTVEEGVAYNIARINIAGFTTTTQLNNWLSTCNANFWYGVKIPTDTTITDTALIAQLDALVSGGAEDGTTYIKVNATDPNLPGLLYVEAPKYE